MFSPSRILVVDKDPDNGALLVRSLLRKFSKVVVQSCRDVAAATGVLNSGEVDAVVLHSSLEMDAASMVKHFRAIDATVPILAVSGLDQGEAALAAGADGFMNYDEWLRVGTVLTAMLEAKRRAVGASAETGKPNPLAFTVNQGRNAEHVENLKKVIATFERTRAAILERRHGMSDGVMVVLDDRLTVNARTLEALNRALELAENELRQSPQREGDE